MIRSRPGNDAGQATSGVLPFQMGGMAREEGRQVLGWLDVVDDSGQRDDSGHHQDNH